MNLTGNPSTAVVDNNGFFLNTFMFPATTTTTRLRNLCKVHHPHPTMRFHRRRPCRPTTTTTRYLHFLTIIRPFPPPNHCRKKVVGSLNAHHECCGIPWWSMGVPPNKTRKISVFHSKRTKRGKRTMKKRLAVYSCSFFLVEEVAMTSSPFASFGFLLLPR